MRSALLGWALAALATYSVSAAPPANRNGDAVIAQDAVEGETPAAGGEGAEYTLFNDIRVPPMKEIEGNDFAEAIKEGYW